MNRKKVIPILIGGFILASSAYIGVRTYNESQPLNESDLLLENIEALATTENQPDGYIVHHTGCVDKNKVPTGKHLAYCYTGGTQPKHEHSCTNCSSI